VLSAINAAVSLSDQGQFAEAEALFRQALALRRKLLGEEHPETAAAYQNLAFNLSAQGKYETAETIWRAAARSFEAARLRVSFAGLERAAYTTEHSPLFGLTASLARAGHATEAWKALEANLARGLLDDLSVRRARPLTDAEGRREQELTGQLQLLDKQIAALLSRKDGIESHRVQVNKLREQREAAVAEWTQFEADLAKRYGPAAGQAYDLARIQAQLPADAALVAWVDRRGHAKAAAPGGEHWACIVRRSGEPVWIALPGSGPKGSWNRDDNPLADQVRRTFTKPPGDATDKWREQAGRLSAQRLSPLAPHLGETKDLPAVRHLIVLPSEALAGVPVEALVEARTAQSPAYAVSYAPSGTVYAWLHEKRKDGPRPEPDGPRLLALGDPVFAQPGKQAPAEAPRDGRQSAEPLGPTRGLALSALPGTRREVIAIAHLFDRADQLLGSRASEQQLDRLVATGRLREYTHLHLATHGVLDSRVALHSALILAQDDLPDPLPQALAGKKAYDGRLTAEQILRTWKLDADLVTLSACQTGLGQYAEGEGYLGFAQALFLAGGRSLVLSLWKVNDNATALLMTRFYQNLLGKRPGLDKPMAKAEALHEAKAWLRGLTAKEVDQRLAELPRGAEVERPSAPAPAALHPYAHPYYWAAFILIGDPR
jgi:CHAT domain-containing protein